MKPKHISDILTGIVLYLLLIGSMYAIPFSSIISWLFFPLPVLFFRLKAGRQSGMLIMLVTLALIMLITRNIAVTALYFGSIFISGFVLGECIEKHFSVERIVLYPFLSALGCWLTVFLLYLILSGQGVGELFSEYIKSYQAAAAQFLSALQDSYPEMQLDSQTFARRMFIILTIVPGIFITSYIMMIYMNLLIIKRVLSKQGIAVSTIENLNLWKAPEPLVYALIAVSVLAFFASGVIKFVSANLIIILLLIYCFQGIAVISFLFQKKEVSLFLRFALYLLIAIMPQILLIVVGFGLFDNWFNFRKLNT